MSSARPSSHYRHQPLPSANHIRLIRFPEGAASADDVSCDIFEADVRSPPDYYGLSYCWGEARDRIAISCNGRCLMVTRSLIGALLRLRRFRPAEDGETCFWIDQICIDQENLDERGAQVQIMMKIYQNALLTLIWPGDFSKEVDGPVVALVEKLAELHKTDPTTASSLLTQAENERLGLPPIESSEWTDLQLFFRRPWFRRVWVVQEVAVSRQTPVLLLGDDILLFDTLTSAMSWLRTRDSYYRNMGYPKVPVLSLMIQGIRQYHNRQLRRPYPWRIDTLLSVIGLYAEATEAGDRIFALLGLSEDTLRDDWPPALSPDYKRPQHLVFRDVARYCIETNQRLFILHPGGNPRQVEDGTRIPTWVPRWDLHPSQLAARNLQREFDFTITAERYIDAKDVTGFNASLNTVLRLKSIGDPDILTLSGLKADSIVRRSEVFADRDFSGRLDGICSLWKMSLEELHQGYTFDDRFFAHALSFVRGIGARFRVLWNETLPIEHFWDFLASYYDKHDCNMDHISPEALAKIKQLAVGGDETNIVSGLAGQRFIITARGRMGYGPGQLDEGDDIL